MSRAWIGIDIGTSGIKFVKLKGRVLEEWGFKSIPLGVIAAGLIKDYGAVSKALSSMFERLDFKRGKVVTCIGGRDVIIRLINIPKVENRELKKFLDWEIGRNLPFSLDEAVYDSYVLRSVFDEEGEKLEILVVATKQSIVEGIYNVFKNIGIEIEAIEASLLPILRVDELVEEKESFMLIDIGAGTVDIAVLHEMRPILFRSLPTGGNAITSALSASLNLDFNKAEELKKGKSIIDLKPYIEDILADLIGEIMHCFDYIIGQFKENVVRSVYITGGVSSLKGLETFLEDQLGIPVKKINPLKGIHLKKETEEIHVFRNRLGLAIGLALRGVY
ncbi:MAG: type IV pilus assembly protein PilM [Synergistetes bacterium]|nr:type IV pilus assembly protein PilM [Synergistota bacterium]MCX8128253.1 type IV pilus assembly protein PilM [Synergistota bacterium]MDW8192700.1 type IV pilus assembly protein PilM [Synergistota bacterium]